MSRNGHFCPWRACSDKKSVLKFKGAEVRIKERLGFLRFRLSSPRRGIGKKKLLLSSSSS